VSFWHYIIGPGLLSSEPVRTAALVGTVVAVTSGVIGVFTVIRGQSFAGHSLADVATTGGAGAFLAGISQFWGFLLAGIGGAALMELIGVQRRRGRDVATGVVLGAALGAAALFLYLGTQSSSNNSTFSILFGSIFVISPGTVPALVVSGALALIVVAVLSRVLLLTALSPELAAARGVPVRAVGVAYLVVLAVAVSLSAVAIGAVLSTALLIGPAAIALRVTKSPGRAMAAAALAGTAATWLGVLLAYDSYYWTSGGRGWPVSFFIVALIVLGYLLTYVRRPRRGRAGQGRGVPAPGEEEAPACSPA
jgi:zinc/manganese transport system permease protein